MSQYNYDQLLGMEVISAIFDQIRRENNRSIRVESVLICYLLYLQKTGDKLSTVSFEDLKAKRFKIDKDILKMVLEYVELPDWQRCQPLLEKYPAEAFYEGVLINVKRSNNTDIDTPEELVSLASQLFGDCSGKDVAEICCGFANFSISLFEKNCSSIDCADTDTEYLDILKIRNKLLGNNVNVIANNVFNLSKQAKKYDCVFSNYPLGVRFYNDKAVESFVKSISDLPPVLSNSSDWVYNTLLASLLKANGKAIAIMSSGSARNSTSASWRSWFIKHGLIETIILLPSGILPSTSISSVMIVISEGNSCVQMIDATKLNGENTGRRYLTSAEIEKVVNSVGKETEYSKTIPYSAIVEKGYDLFPKSYLEDTISFKHEVPFGSVLLKVSRGAVFGAKELSSLVTDSDTGIRYLQLKNIERGIIDENLLSLTKVDEEYERCCAENNALVLPKIYSDGKIALIEKKASETIVVSGNMFILDVDETLVSPVYVKAFLESSYGKKLLRTVTTGGRVSSINLKALKSMPFPLPDKETQKNIENNYLAAQDEVRICRHRLSRAEERISLVFDEGGDWLA